MTFKVYSPTVKKSVMSSPSCPSMFIHQRNYTQKAISSSSRSHFSVIQLNFAVFFFSDDVQKCLLSVQRAVDDSQRGTAAERLNDDDPIENLTGIVRQPLKAN